MKEINIQKTRRELLKTCATVVGSLTLLNNTKTLASICGPQTPPQTEGPFYPIEDQLDKDADLTRVKGRLERAQGQVIYLQGVVRDQHCRPVSGALVEIWQACASGRYNHPGDNSGNPLDPNFQYWGRVLTGLEGKFLFKTIIPGKYKTAPDSQWIRPPHIHVKVLKRGAQELTTQLYFKGEPLNEADHIFMALTPAQRKQVLVDFQPTANDGNWGPGSLLGEIDLYIKTFE